MNRFFIRVLNKLAILKYFNLSLNIQHHYKETRVPLLGRQGLENVHLSELWMISILEKIIPIKKGLAYLDVGVNIGQTLIKVKSIDPGMEYIGFEPNPQCIHYVSTLIKKNNYPNTLIFPVGIANEDKLFELNFYTDKDTDSSASIIKNFRPSEKVLFKQFIPCFTFNTIRGIYNFPKIGIIKIDVEGAELEVLKGLSETLRRDRPFIQLEILPVYEEQIKERLIRQEEIEQMMKDFDYIVCRVHYDERHNLKGLEVIESIGIHSNLNWCEYLMIPSADLHQIQTSFKLMY